MSTLTKHGACEKTWQQRGNRTGHCAACHETFEGLAVFDAHRRLNDTGTRICTDPALVMFRKEPLRLVDGTWRGPERPDNTWGTDETEAS